MKNIFLALFLVCTIANSEDSFFDTIKEKTTSTYEAVKQKVSNTTTEDIKDGAKDGYKATKEFIDEKTEPSLWEKTKQYSKKAWDTTKTYSKKAWEVSKQKYEEVSK
jgi:hypothetical protein